MIYTVSSMENLIRSGLNESATTRISSSEILTALNDGCKEVSSRALCIEREEDAFTVSGNSLVKFSGHKVKQVSVVSLDTTPGGSFTDTPAAVFTDTGDVIWEDSVEEDLINIGIPCILPTNVGTTKLRSIYPRSWFPWGSYIYIQPKPTARYQLKLYVADWPDAAMALSADTPEDLPEEFHACVVDFALYVLAAKFRRWGKMAGFYNRYIYNLTKAKYEYAKRRAERRSTSLHPDNVAYQGGAAWVH